MEVVKKEDVKTKLKYTEINDITKSNKNMSKIATLKSESLGKAMIWLLCVIVCLRQTHLGAIHLLRNPK